MDQQWIACQGKPYATIVLPAEHGSSAAYAASELKHYLDLMTGVSIPLVHSLPSPGSSAIILLEPGTGQPASGKQPADLDEPGPDGFSISRQDSSLIINGGVRGIIYGVYELLEQLGCRFLTPLCEHIPVCCDLPLPDLQIRQKPVLEYRYHNYITFTGYPRFAVKSRINGPAPIKPKFGGHVSYAWFVHTFDHMISPDTYFDEHPEYFSMVDGRRIRERTQLCLTNPDVLRIAISKVQEALREKPGSTLISVSQNDWYNPCTCPDCQAIDLMEGSHAGSLIWFVNQVAEAIEAEFPSVIVDTLAYQYSRPAPRSIRPRHNVCVRLCSIEACFSHPLTTCNDPDRQVLRPDGSRSGFMNDLQDWAKVCDRLYIWDYTTCFAHYPAPFPNWHVLQPNMQAFVQNNVKGVFEQANGALGGGVDLNELRAYLIGKLLWDADCDLEHHIQDFLAHVYGAAAPMIRSYMQLLTDTVEQENIHLGFNDNCDRAHLRPEKLAVYDAVLDEAERVVAHDPVRLPRVARIRLSLRWVSMKNRAMTTGHTDPHEVNRFFTDWRAHGLTRIDEWVSAETTHRALLEGHWRGVAYIDPWWAEGPEEL